MMVFPHILIYCPGFLPFFERGLRSSFAAAPSASSRRNNCSVRSTWPKAMLAQLGAVARVMLPYSETNQRSTPSSNTYIYIYVCMHILVILVVHIYIYI